MIDLGHVVNLVNGHRALGEHLRNGVHTEIRWLVQLRQHLLFSSVIVVFNSMVTIHATKQNEKQNTTSERFGINNVGLQKISRFPLKNLQHQSKYAREQN